MSDARPDDRPDDGAPFIPEGAGSEAWRTYVDRVRERRFRALLAAIDAAVHEGNAPGARAALAEASELEPDAPELADRAGRVAAVELGSPAERHPAFHRPTSGAAAALIAVAMAMLAVLLVVFWIWRPQPAPIIVVAPPPAEVAVGTTARIEAPPAPAASPAPAATPVPAAAIPTPAARAAVPITARAAVPISNDNITDRLAIRRVLDWYAASYSRRDIDAVAAITPDVDTTYLAREFATRERQDLHFRRCLIDIRGSQATARCVGELHYMPRAGVPASRPVRWDFTMAEENRGWVIEDVMRR